MENASKALVMAGGILIALLIIGALMLMFNNLSSYQDSNEQNLQEAAIVEFNKEFIGYERNNVTGTELISLANKIESYKKMKSDNDDYNKMEITIKNLKKFGLTNLFGNIGDINQKKLLEITQNPRDKETKYGSSKIKQLISNLDALPEKKKTVKEILGVDDSYCNSVNNIYAMREYSEFKTKTFTGKITGYTKDSKVQKLEFTAN